MVDCSNCRVRIPADAAFCPYCGKETSSISNAPTAVPGRLPEAARPPAGLSARSASVSSISMTPDSGTRFIPGMILAERYRLIGPLGKGGMGEVYRADDLKLGQPVALKFLPKAVAADTKALGRFYSEVRLARQVTHPNVCRIYDISEADGQHFITMEFVDGEDLASLRRRVGRLSEAKSIQIARQLCAGLIAAHSQGILHRDLKPANIMIDGRGRVRISDFGLAALVGELTDQDVRAGTPAYMAPEQLRGEQVSVRSDVYALGLVLFELFTGESARRGHSLAELLRESQEPPPSPSSEVDGLNPAVERIIIRCLEPNPQRRPESVIQVAASLPGGDPLAEALKAGETPSPEMVAAARTTGGFTPGWSVALLGAILLFALALLWIHQEVLLLNGFEPPQRPEVLESDTRRKLQELGFTPARHYVRGYAWDGDFDTYFRTTEDSMVQDVSQTRPSILHFWYRESMEPLVPMNYVGWVTREDPPPSRPGMTSVTLDPYGRLLELVSAPPDREEPPPDRDEIVDPWNLLFDWAGLDRSLFRPTLPAWRPPVQCDQRAAWVGAYPGPGNEEVRVEAGSIRSVPHYFRVVPRWRTSDWERQVKSGPESGLEAGLYLGLLVVTTLGSLALARRNLSSGRGDRRGALRIALFVLVAFFLFWLLRADHVLAMEELLLLQWALSTAIFLALVVWILYVALEPYVRRLWPDTIVSWSRLITGKVRDPLVGRDFLAGAAAGVAIALVVGLSRLLSLNLDEAGARAASTHLEVLAGIRQGVSLLFSQLTDSVVSPLALIVLILLFRVVLRKEWLAVTGVILLFISFQALRPDQSFVSMAASALVWVIALVMLRRFGLISAIVMFYYAQLPFAFPVNGDLSTWYNGRSLPLLLIPTVLVIYAFYLSLAGRPLLKKGLLDS